MMYKVADTVVLTRDVPEAGLQTGDVGTVVQTYEPEGLEVEFISALGRTEALVTLSIHDVRHMADGDLPAVRPFRRTA